MIRQLAFLALVVGASNALPLNITCRGSGYIIRDEQNLCSFWRCMYNLEGRLEPQIVACPEGSRIPCDLSQRDLCAECSDQQIEAETCDADPCTERDEGDCSATSQCPEDSIPPEDDKKLDGESLELYLDNCLPTEGRVDELHLHALGSLRCNPPSDNRDCRNPAFRFAVSPDTGNCDETTTCDFDHSFETIEECQFTCDDPCEQPPDSGTRECEYPPPLMFYYYDEESNTCRESYDYWCGGYKNRFETIEECNKLCLQRSDVPVLEPSRFTFASSSVVRRLARQTLQDESESYEFCSMFKRTFPHTVNIIDEIENLTSTQINPLGLTQLAHIIDGQITAVNETSQVSEVRRQKRQFNPLGLHLRRLHWITVVKKKNCKTFDVTVRVYCINSLLARRVPSRAEKNRLCTLIRQGIEHYWSTTINYAGSQWTVNVKAKERFFLSKKIVLKYYTSNTGNTRSHNSDFFPMTMKYLLYKGMADADEDFRRTAAHEATHSLAMNDRGLVWSWGHKGTSSIFGNIIAPPATSHPLAPAPIDIFLYYTDSDPSDYSTRARLAESEVYAMINEAMFYFPWGFCPQQIGALCLRDTHCFSGHCHWFRCVECGANWHCATGQYCHGVLNPFKLNTCKAKKSNGQFCLKDSQCISGYCDGARCVPCEQDGHCPSGQYCKYNNNPLILNRCVAKKSLGQLCFSDSVCASSHCSGGRCVACESNSHCASGQYCWGVNLPLTINVCKNKLGNGAACVRDSQCASNRCHGFRCGECEADYHCPGGYCKNLRKPFFTNYCRAKLYRGWCDRGAMCISGKCRAWFRCKRP